ncbi:MAG TPA: prepilin-type N-terminal cleavage/methylation domain-containing protein [Candidatus Hydrogenedentes bacterium]|mgnify:CR=1 FL=1|nr:prepilin-type N-terminal cleavage/methylation domain-containing protein [Candidatus Hydrogenedentota bacterium]HPG65294.1 prepilin-type N-terminal cleavage/methylation domain-containing protein [Candidatus Hydrogenedentota bacterium]
MQNHGHRASPHGFTLAELIVASTLITVVMASVYTAFNSTMRVRRLGESDLNTYQDARVALGVLCRELGCIIGGTEHLFQGEDDQFEFFAVSPPMDVEEGMGSRVLWISYRYNRSSDTLYREEAIVKDALPIRRPEGEDGKEDDETEERIKLGRKHKFELACNVKDFEVWYFWMPPDTERESEEPPSYIEPVILEENNEGWGLPQGLKIALTVEDPNAQTGETTFVTAVTFRGPTTPFDAGRLGVAMETTEE